MYKIPRVIVIIQLGKRHPNPTIPAPTMRVFIKILLAKSIMKKIPKVNNVDFLSVLVYIITMEYPGGAPRICETPEIMQERIDRYFEECAKPNSQEKISITGLCLWLGFCDRHSFYDYEKKPAFTHTVRRARLRIEKFYETRGESAKSSTFHIFALKNFGWTDKQEIEHSGTMGVIRLPQKKPVGATVEPPCNSETLDIREEASHGMDTVSPSV
jgi:hypothetical protein